MKTKLLITLVFSVLLISCKKKPVTVPNAGIYNGMFTEYDSTGNPLAQGSFVLALFTHNSTYQLSGDSVNFSPPTHKGEWYTNNATTAVFSTAYSGYNPNYYLDTVYNYTFDNINFTLTQTIDGKIYEYVMVRD
ncbi:hypothetical protein K6119_02960 [Paracrocinitomix mangrovi]|uniref:hypothetical protein n=1 Tax=Paracrocinitomix mangrovi TaxID=2862509 RepID=UPI001C8E4D24|nr:hypothetical protein [Paracrocinitomix mangrovi]UKN02480.1 hypothetical protein K6119_02960 [Paracrocinitomix mangrovi]